MKHKGKAANGAARRENATKQSDACRPPRSEWIAAGIGIVLLLVALGQLLVSALVRDETPPDIVLSVEHVTEGSESFIVTIRASNHGDAAAAEVEIEGTLRLEDGTTETGTFTLDYLPPRSERRGGLLFSARPDAGKLILRARGFASP